MAVTAPFQSLSRGATALESSMVGNDTAASRGYYECDADCRLHFAHRPAMLVQLFAHARAGLSLIQDGKVIRQHCPKIASGEANRHPYVSPRMAGPSWLCLAGPMSD